MAAKAASAAGPQRYRFRVRTPDGQEVVSEVIDLLGRDAKLKNPRWGDGTKPMLSTHQDDLHMNIDAPGMDGRKVRFIVERLESGSWVKHAEAVGPVKGGVASGKIKALHPAGDKKTGHTKESLAPVPLRFKVELV